MEKMCGQCVMFSVHIKYFAPSIVFYAFVSSVILQSVLGLVRNLICSISAKSGGVSHCNAGAIKLWSTAGTKLYHNPQIMETEDLCKSGEECQVIMKDSEEDTPLSLEELSSKDRVTISDLQKIGLDDTKQNHTYTVKATIFDIDSTNWFYMCCPTCNIKVEDENSTCNSCTNVGKPAIARYKVSSNVEDETGDTTFVAFGANAQHIFEKPIFQVMKLIKKRDADKLVEEFLGKAIGKSHIFQVKVTQYSLQENFQSFTISNIFPATTDTLNKSSVENIPSSKRICLRDD